MSKLQGASCSWHAKRQSITENLAQTTQKLLTCNQHNQHAERLPRKPKVDRRECYACHAKWGGCQWVPRRPRKRRWVSPSVTSARQTLRRPRELARARPVCSCGMNCLHTSCMSKNKRGSLQAWQQLVKLEASHFWLLNGLRRSQGMCQDSFSFKEQLPPIATVAAWLDFGMSIAQQIHWLGASQATAPTFLQPEQNASTLAASQCSLRFEAIYKCSCGMSCLHTSCMSIRQ